MAVLRERICFYRKRHQKEKGALQCSFSFAKIHEKQTKNRIFNARFCGVCEIL